MRDNELESYIQEKLDTGSKIWVIGDVHGFKKTLDALVKKLELKDNDLLICLGDMIDRGPESLEVLELFLRNNNYFSLKGNHEEMLQIDWKKTNGERNYSKDGFWSTSSLLTRSRMISAFEYISLLPTELVLESFRLVHAGYGEMPYSNDLDLQTDNERLWSRDIFDVSYPFDTLRTIIVGHTPVQNFDIFDDNSVWRSSILLKDGRVSSIGMDTGIFLKREMNPRLSALELSSGRVISQKRVEIIREKVDKELSENRSEV